MRLHKIKILLILLVIFITTGCTANYSLNINKNGSINEVIIVKDLTTKLNNSEYGSADQIIEMLLNDQYNNISGYRIEKIEGKYTGIKFTRDYISFEDYKKKTKAYEYLNTKSTLTRKDNIVNIETSNITNTSKSNLYKVDNLYVKIVLPYYKVTDSNYDSTKSYSEYYWNIKVNNKEYIKFSYNEKKIVSRYRLEIVGISFICLVIILLVKKKKIFRRKK